MRLNGKVAVVTGAASGIGRESALLFASEGARVITADVQEDEGKHTVKMIAGQGGQGQFVVCDISRGEEVRRLMDTVRATHGRLDVLFANAGIGGFGTYLDNISEERWQRILNIDLTGPFLCMKYAIPLMVESGGGSIILTSSIGGIAAFPGSAAYSAAKGALVAMMRTAAVEYAPQQVRVNAICPGYIQTNLSSQRYTNREELEVFWRKMANDTPLGRIGDHAISPTWPSSSPRTSRPTSRVCSFRWTAASRPGTSHPGGLSAAKSER